MQYNSNRGKGKAAKSGRELIPLSIDSEKIEVEPLTIEEHMEIIEKFSKFLPN